jgi:hypothetical protein
MRPSSHFSYGRNKAAEIWKDDFMTAQNNEQNQKQQGDSNQKPGQQSQSPANDPKQADQKKQDQAGAQKDSV